MRDYHNNINNIFENTRETLGKIKLRQAGLTLKPSKCVYAKEEVKILGFNVSSSGFLPDYDKLRAGKEFPIPKSVKNIQSFAIFTENFTKFCSNTSIFTRSYEKR